MPYVALTLLQHLQSVKKKMTTQIPKAWKKVMK